jgi:hypothetical protein
MVHNEYEQANGAASNHVTMLVRSKYPIVDSCEISYRTSEFGTMSQQTTTSELLNSEP